MKALQDDLKIYSEEVRDVLSSPPNAIYKRGNTILLLFILLLLFLSYFIKYPDVVTAPIKITTPIPPEKLIAKSSGRIQNIYVTNNQTITKNTILAILENTADYAQMIALSKDLSEKVNEATMMNIVNKYADSNLGNVQQAFSVFEKDFINFQQYSVLQPYSVEKKSQNYEQIEQNKRLKLLYEQQKIANNELTLKKNEQERYNQLYQKGIISLQEWETRKIDYLQIEKNIRNIQTQISQIKSSISELNRNQTNTSISESKDDVNFYKNCLQSYSQLQKAVKDWELLYLIRSSIDGKVSFLQYWTENQSVTQGDEVFVVVPKDKKYFLGKVVAVAQNSGKIKKNQKVNIKLANYPDNEFGIIEGKVSNISSSPDKNGNLIIDVILPKGLETSYHKKIEFRQEMIGNAEIITEDLRLIQRFLYQFRSMWKR
jgi:multidrug resistance efflux pump